MSLGVLNNLSAVFAENNLNNTQNSLNTTLQQLSSGSQINSGADDPAGLSLVDGLAANSAALTQSSINATEGVGLLQVADGALSQVTSLLNSAITLATEASNGTLNSTQLAAANQEYTSILDEVNNIGSTTTYNQQAVFGSNTDIYTGDSSQAGSSIDDLNISALSSSTVGQTGGVITYTEGGTTIDLGTGSTATNALVGTGDLTLSNGDSVNLASDTSASAVAAAITADGLTATASQTYTGFTLTLGAGVAGATTSDALTTTAGTLTLANGATVNIAAGTTSTIADLESDISAADSSATFSLSGAGVLTVTEAAGTTDPAVTTSTFEDTGATTPATAAGGTLTATKGDEEITIAGGTATLATGASIADTTAATTATLATKTATISYNATNATTEDLTGTNLLSNSAAQSTLTDLNTAISDVASQDGYVGAQINTLNAVSNVESTQQENIESAQNAVQATDYAAATSNLSKYEILEQTGISALAQANSVEQEVTKLLQ